MAITNLEPVLVGFKDAQKMTGLGRDYLSGLLVRGEIRSFRMGTGANASYRIPVAEIEKWVARQISRQEPA